MVTAKELRDKHTLLEIRLGGNKKKLQWLATTEFQYSKLERMNAKDVVDFMLSDQSISQDADANEITRELRAYIQGEGRGNYQITTADGEVMSCQVDERTNEIMKDQRSIPLLNILIPLTATLAGSKTDIWYQELRISKPTFLGYDQ